MLQGCYDAGVDFVKENSDILIGLGMTFALLMVNYFYFLTFSLGIFYTPMRTAIFTQEVTFNKCYEKVTIRIFSLVSRNSWLCNCFGGQRVTLNLGCPFLVQSRTTILVYGNTKMTI